MPIQTNYHQVKGIRDYVSYQQQISKRSHEYNVSIDTENETNYNQYWGVQADKIDWFQKPKIINGSNFFEGRSRWFSDGKLNLSLNCVDRHAITHPDKIAIHFMDQSNVANSQDISFRELERKVKKVTQILRIKGIKKCDHVVIYMSMCPEVVFTILACARIGAIHVVVFSAFSAEALAARCYDCNAKAIVSQDILKRGDKVLRLDEKVKDCQQLLKEGHNDSMCPVTFIFRRESVSQELNDCILFYENGIENGPCSIDEKELALVDSTPEIVDSLHPSFVLYTSGSTGKPKGIVHSTGGYAVYAAMTFKNIFNYEEGDVLWCTADVGWITGHTYGIYGPLLNGTSIVLLDGSPLIPPTLISNVVKKYKVNILYTAPTLIRTLMTLKKHINYEDLKSLKLLGSVGEPIGEAAWNWYKYKFGSGCDIVDTYWQTETGGIIFSPKPGVKNEQFHGQCVSPFFGVSPLLNDDNSYVINEYNHAGELCIKNGWPGLALTILNDHQRWVDTYFRKHFGCYSTGDSALVNEDGHFIVKGRVDDLMKVSGHLLSTAEIESTINSVAMVKECAVVGRPHLIKGQCLSLYVCINSVELPELDTEDYRNYVVELQTSIKEKIGNHSIVDDVIFCENLPKTRSGKILRRLLKVMANILSCDNHTVEFGDATVVEDPTHVSKVMNRVRELQSFRNKSNN